jgi:hypothetical protein
MVPMLKLNGTNETTLNAANVWEMIVLFWCFPPVLTEHSHLGYYTLGTIIWQINAECYIFANGNLFTICTNGITVAGILTNGKFIWNYCECLNQYGQTIKHTGQLQYIQIYLDKCRDKQCIIIFKIDKGSIVRIEGYSGYFIYHLNTNTQILYNKYFSGYLSSNGKGNNHCSLQSWQLNLYLFWK